MTAFQDSEGPVDTCGNPANFSAPHLHTAHADPQHLTLESAQPRPDARYLILTDLIPS